MLRAGETLYALSRRYGVSVDTILRANKIADANKLNVGQKLIIPGQSAPADRGETAKHTVAKGETLYGIAKRYGMTLSELRALNKLTEKSLLKTGDVLIVATAAEEAVTPAPAAITSNPAPVEPRVLTQKTADPSIRWPVRAKELSYMEGKLFGVLLTGEKDEVVESLTDGTVVSAEAYRGFGQVAIVQASDGYVYVYGGNERLSVRSGDRVASGAELGRLGIDALTGKPSLFFFVYKDNAAVDPAKAPRS